MQGCHFKLYKLNTFRHCELCSDKLIPNSKMETCIERVNKIPEGLTLSEDIVDHLLMVNGFRFKIVGTYCSPYCLYLNCNYTCNHFTLIIKVYIFIDFCI